MSRPLGVRAACLLQPWQEVPWQPPRPRPRHRKGRPISHWQRKTSPSPLLQIQAGGGCFTCSAGTFGNQPSPPDRATRAHLPPPSMQHFGLPQTLPSRNHNVGWTKLHRSSTDLVGFGFNCSLDYIPQLHSSAVTPGVSIPNNTTGAESGSFHHLFRLFFSTDPLSPMLIVLLLLLKAGECLRKVGQGINQLNLKQGWGYLPPNTAWCRGRRTRVRRRRISCKTKQVLRTSHYSLQYYNFYM